MQDPKTIGARIRALRRKRDLSQAQLAIRMSIDPGVISRWERDVHGVSLDNLHQLAAVLGVSLDVLQGREPIPEMLPDQTVTLKTKTGRMGLEAPISQLAIETSEGRTGIAVTKVWLAKMTSFMTHARSKLDDMVVLMDAARGDIESMERQATILRQRLEHWFKDVEGPEATELLAMFEEADEAERIREARRMVELVQRGERALREHEAQQKDPEEKAS